MLSNVFNEDAWYRELVDDYRDLRVDELPSGIASGCEFGSVCINTALYLPWLVGQCRANGVTFHRKSLTHIMEIRSLEHDGPEVDVVINATGLSAGKLGGVLDKTVYPIRGQTVVVRNVAPYMAVQSGTDDGDDQACYMMTRASGGGTILGGTMQPGCWKSEPDQDTAELILKRAVSLVPELTDGRGIEHFDIIRHGVGLRPGREAGVRLEKEKVEGIWVVHNYGHAGWGYQGSFGCAEEVVDLVNGISRQSKL
jgi:glycine/D-amino acid oxidase-like deaminating enzyme